MPHVSLLVEALLKAKTAGLGSKVSLQSRMARSVFAGERNDLVGDVRNMVTGFLQDDCMKSSASGGHDLCRIPARWSWIPLQNGEVISMMRELTVRIVNVAQVQQVWPV